MASTTRIPTLLGNSYQSMSEWYKLMAAADLLFHPDDAPQDIVRISDGVAAFTKEECNQLEEVMSLLFEQHGDQVYEAAYPYFMKTLESAIIG